MRYCPEYDSQMDDSMLVQVNGISPLLAAFDAAASVGHFTHAADLLGVPQSSLSRRIKQLERELGVELFQPDGRGVALTVQGRDLHERIHQLVQALDTAITAIRENADPEAGLIRFGFPLTLGPVSVPALLAKFHRSAPRMRLNLMQAHGEALVQMLRDGRLDLAIVIPAPEGLPLHLLGHQPLQLCVSSSHTLSGRATVSAAELAGEKFIANPPSYHLRQVLEAWAKAAGFAPTVTFEITEFDTIRSLVAHGLGIALLPPSETPYAGLAAINVEDSLERTIGLTEGTHKLTRAAERLRDFLLANWPQHLPEQHRQRGPA
jgi:DNA-binding transcriptional LysR family regulator